MFWRVSGLSGVILPSVWMIWTCERLGKGHFYPVGGGFGRVNGGFGRVSGVAEGVFMRNRLVC